MARCLYLILMFLTNGGTVALIADRVQPGRCDAVNRPGTTHVRIHTSASGAITPRTPVGLVFGWRLCFCYARPE